MVRPSSMRMMGGTTSIVSTAKDAHINCFALANDSDREAGRNRDIGGYACQHETLMNLSTAVAKAQLDLSRIVIRSPVNGYVTNLLAQFGDYATVGQKLISVVDTDSFWVDGYFEETSLGRIHGGDPATVKLMGYSRLILGHVGGVARGINVPNAQPDRAGLASVNPIFTWVRLAQRVPVRIHIDQVPDGLRLVAGMTATVQIDPHPRASPP